MYGTIRVTIISEMIFQWPLKIKEVENDFVSHYYRKACDSLNSLLILLIVQPNFSPTHQKSTITVVLYAEPL